MHRHMGLAYLFSFDSLLSYTNLARLLIQRESWVPTATSAEYLAGYMMIAVLTSYPLSPALHALNQ